MRNVRWIGSAGSIGTYTGSPPTVGRTRPPIRTCWNGCTSPKPTASCEPTNFTARAPYGVLAATAVSMLPLWARVPLLLPYFPPVELTVVRSVGRVLIGGIRWALPAPAVNVAR
jgi:hypothetical protein